MFAQTPEPPYIAVIFTSRRTQGDQGYSEMAEEIASAACDQPGYLGIESVRDDEGNGITVSYWESMEAVKDWKQHARHRTAQAMGKSTWYEKYIVRICTVEREYSQATGRSSV